MACVRSMNRRRLLGGVGAALACTTLPRSAIAREEPLTGPFRTLDELDASLSAADIGAAERRRLLALARPCAALQSEAAADEDIAIGASKIGGAPDLPRSLAWPTRVPSQEARRTVEKWTEGAPQEYRQTLAAKIALAQREAPLTFMLQVDLAACAATGELDPDIPRSGRLSVFYDLVFKPWSGHDEDGSARFQVLHVTEDADDLERKSLPDLGHPLFGDEEDYRAFRNQLPPARLMPVFTYTLPDKGSMPFRTYYPRKLKVPHDDWMYHGPTHLNASNRLGGWPENIQGDMATEFAAAEHKIELPFSNEFWKVAERIQPLADEWVHLLQIGDYDNTINDFDGLFHVWIKREHLRARAFSKAKLVFRTS